MNKGPGINTMFVKPLIVFDVREELIRLVISEAVMLSGVVVHYTVTP